MNSLMHFIQFKTLCARDLQHKSILYETCLICLSYLSVLFFFLIVCLLFLCVLWALLPDSNEKALRETQTLRAGCSKAKPKNFTPLHTPFPGARDDQNLISWRSMVTTFTYKSSLARSDTRNFEL